MKKIIVPKASWDKKGKKKYKMKNFDELIATESSIEYSSVKDKDVSNISKLDLSKKFNIDEVENQEENAGKKLEKVKRGVLGSMMESANFKFKDKDEGISQKFKPYQKIIENLTNSITLKTNYDVINVDWTNDGERFLVVTKKEDEFYEILQICGMNFNTLWQRELEGDYIKVSKVIQNKMSSVFCAPYLKDGEFKVLIFNKETELHDINISQMLGINEYNRPNDNFPYPHMDCCFINDQTIFINLYRTS